MQQFTSSMARAANNTLDWVRALAYPQQQRRPSSQCILRTLEAYRLQPVSIPVAMQAQQGVEDAA